MVTPFFINFRRMEAIRGHHVKISLLLEGPGIDQSVFQDACFFVFAEFIYPVNLVTARRKKFDDEIGAAFVPFFGQVAEVVCTDEEKVGFA